MTKQKTIENVEELRKKINREFLIRPTMPQGLEEHGRCASVPRPKRASDSDALPEMSKHASNMY